MYSIVVNSTGATYNLGNTLVGQLWLIISGHVMEMEVFQFHHSVAYSAPVECNTRQLEKNYRLNYILENKE